MCEIRDSSFFFLPQLFFIFDRAIIHVQQTSYITLGINIIISYKDIISLFVHNKRNEFPLSQNVVVWSACETFQPACGIPRADRDCEKKSTKHSTFNDVQHDAGAAGRKIRVRVARGILMAL